MKTIRKRNLTLPALAMFTLLGGITLNSCMVGNPTAPNCAGDFGTADAALKLRAFLDATNSFSATAMDLDTTLLRECTAMATDLGAAPASLMATASMTATEVACTEAASRIRTSMRAIRAAMGVAVILEVVPAVCRVNVDAYSQCAARCDVRYQPAMSTVMCAGGELRGGCTGMCTGSCAVAASAMCTGSCEGTCSGSCMGTCQGVCEGMCGTRDAQGSCMGTCMGTCRGTCSANCTGSCMGSCVANASATCMGECRGSCSVAFTEPRCTGRVIPPMVDADCRASCYTRFNATAECSPAQISVRATGDLGMLQAQATALFTTLQAHYPAVLTLSEKLQRLVTAGVATVESARRVPGAVTTLGVAAGVCATQAASQIQVAAPKVQVSVQVSLSVTAAVNGQ